MKARLLGATLALLATTLISTGNAVAAPAPGWSLDSVAVPTNFTPGGSEEPSYQVTAFNVGGAATNGSQITLTDRLPAGLELESVELRLPTPESTADFGSELCSGDESGASTVVSCVIPPAVAGAFEPTRVRPGESLTAVVYVRVPADVAGPLLNEVEIEGGGVAAQVAQSRNEASAQPAPAGLSEASAAAFDESGQVLTQAGGRPFQYVTTYAVNTATAPGERLTYLPSGGNVKDIEVALPPGLVGNPTAVSTCGVNQFQGQQVLQRPSGFGQNFRNFCPAGSVVGYIVLRQLEGVITNVHIPVFELEPPRGMPAQFGFQILGSSFYINTKVRSGSDYGITAYLANLAEVKRASSASVVFWGVPGATSHDALRGDCLNESPSGYEGASAGSCGASITPRPFLSNATSCGQPQAALFSFDTWLNPGAFESAESPAPPNTGCGSVPFNPSITARPQTTVADSPTGLDVDLHVEQNNTASGLATADLRDAVVTLPAGLSVNPASAGGLGACTPAQVGLTTAVGQTPIHFTGTPAACPASSKLGTVEVDTPLLDHPIDGSVYLASQGQNPFGSLLALYIAADDEQTGVVVKLAGHVEADPQSGQLTTRFAENPQLPFEDLRLHFFEGPKAALRTPVTCGSFTTTTDLTPWSAPQSGPDATPSDSFAVSSSPTGAPCAASEAQLPSSPKFEAGTESVLAGAYSPFVLKLSREDGTQPIAAINTTLPEGLLGRLAGVPYCSEAAIAAAAANSGAAEQVAPSCPAASQVGTVDVAAGAGTQPLQVSGRAYLAGPYKGAPLSLAIVTPAVAGPLDLGTVVVRTALRVNPTTAQVEAVSDPIPQILQGIPLDVRRISLNLNRPRFTLNPTSCEPKQIIGSETSPLGQASSLQSYFQVGGCKGLDFQPKLSLSLKGGIKRAKNPALKAVLTQPSGQANIGRAVVILPKSEFIDSRHIKSPCTRVQFDAGVGNGAQCPAASILGRATAYSPLLEQPLSGNVYFRSNGGERELPDLVASLDGQIHVNLVGFIDSVHIKGTEASRVRNTFASVPDAPVSRFVLELAGGRKGLLQNSTNLCRSTNKATVKMTAQSGKVNEFESVVKPSCPKGKAKKSRK